MEAPDERSPLLQTSGSRVRIRSAYDATRVPDLSRNDSYTGPSCTETRASNYAITG